MAIRPVFTVREEAPFYEQENIGFSFYSGLSLTQAQKSVSSMHAVYKEKNPDIKVLEISTKSTNLLGIKLSAFNLMYRLSNGHEYCIESVFQSGKCFADGTQFPDLLYVSPYEAKKDERIRQHGDVDHFMLERISFPNNPPTFFYDWLYANALRQHPRLVEELMQYSAFTDIAFNPQRSINCQARSAAIFVSLLKTNILSEALSSPNMFRQIVYGHLLDQKQPPLHQAEQLSFL